MSIMVGHRHVDPRALALRAMGIALGLLFGALLTATAASAQTADLTIRIDTATGTFNAGDTVNLTITVTNHGPSAVTDVAMVNIFPPDTSGAGGGSNPAGWTCSLNIPGSMQCTNTTMTPLGAGESAVFHLPFHSSTQTPSGAVRNDAIVTSTTVDPNPANNLASLQLTVNGGAPATPADLAVTKDGPATVQPGQNLAYTITLTNNPGPNAASSPKITEATPPNTTFVSIASPAGWSCPHPSVGQVGRVECSLPFGTTLAPGATATFTLTVQAQAGTPSGVTITNVVTVDQNVGSTVDPTLTNNRATLDTLIALPTATPTATATATSTPTATPTSTRTPCILGDINCDGIVDIRDYGLWRQAFGATSYGNPADLDGNCIVDIRDYGIWRANFGHTAGGAPRGETVPAPHGTPSPVLLGRDTAATSSSRLQSDGAVPAVPVIPLVGGLLGLRGLAAWRTRRLPRAE
jgi:uncharacterized repeat protein (TIGR01451 family)